MWCYDGVAGEKSEVEEAVGSCFGQRTTAETLKVVVGVNHVDFDGFSIFLQNFAKLTETRIGIRNTNQSDVVFGETDSFERIPAVNFYDCRHV